MSRNQNGVRNNYLLGVNDLTGKNIVTDELLNLVYSIDLDEEDESENLAEQYYILTKGLIRKQSGGNVPPILLNGLSEAITQKVLAANQEKALVSRSVSNSHYIEGHICDILLANTGVSESVECLLTTPVVYFDALDKVHYENHNSLLDHLVEHLKGARREYNVSPYMDFGHSFEVMSCCEAILYKRDEIDLTSPLQSAKKKIYEKE